MLRRAPAVQDRDPHGVAVGVGVGVGVGRRDLEAADGDRHPRAGRRPCRPGRDPGRRRRRPGRGCRRRCRARGPGSRRSRACRGRRPPSRRARRAPGRPPARWRRPAFTVLPGFDLRAARGILREHRAGLGVRVLALGRRRAEAGLLERRLGVRARLADHVRHGDLLAAARHHDRDRGALAHAGPLGRRRLDHAVLLHGVGVLALLLGLEARPRAAGRSPRRRPGPGRPGRRLARPARDGDRDLGPLVRLLAGGGRCAATRSWATSSDWIGTTVHLEARALQLLRRVLPARSPTTSGTLLLFGRQQQVGADGDRHEREHGSSAISAIQRQLRSSSAPRRSAHRVVGDHAARRLLERGDELVGVLVALVRVLAQRAQHDRLERRRDGRVAHARRDRLLGDLLERDRDRRLRVERHRARSAARRARRRSSRGRSGRRPGGPGPARARCTAPCP